VHNKIKEISRITNKSLEEVMYLTQLDADKVDAYYYIVITCL
jgi:hypothetical protein